MCVFMFMCLLCALIVSVTIASAAAIFAIAVAAFLVFSIVTPSSLKQKLLD